MSSIICVISYGTGLTYTDLVNVADTAFNAGVLDEEDHLNGTGLTVNVADTAFNAGVHDEEDQLEQCLNMPMELRSTNPVEPLDPFIVDGMLERTPLKAMSLDNLHALFDRQLAIWKGKGMEPVPFAAEIDFASFGEGKKASVDVRLSEVYLFTLEQECKKLSKSDVKKLQISLNEFKDLKKKFLLVERALKNGLLYVVETVVEVDL